MDNKTKILRLVSKCRKKARTEIMFYDMLPSKRFKMLNTLAMELENIYFEELS